MLPAMFTRRSVPGMSVLTGLDPFAQVSRLFDLFDDRGPAACGCGFDVDVREAEGRYLIEANLPGLERENVNLTVENGVLTIEADQRSETENQGEGYHVRERRVGKVSRSFRLPKEVDADKIGAELKNGVLRLTIPKAESAKPKKIQVKVEGE